MVPPPSPSGSPVDGRLAELLRELGPRLRRGGLPGEALARCPTGIPELDRLLGGGFPRGRLSEIAGPGSCGRTSLALCLLSEATRAGEVVAVADGADAFDPASAEAAGVVLERVLWMRARQPREALRGAERLLEARGFAVVLLDLGAPGPRVAAASWLRLAQTAAASGTALVVLSLARAAGSAAELALELAPRRACFTGTPALLEAFDTEIALVRQRAGRFCGYGAGIAGASASCGYGAGVAGASASARLRLAARFACRREES